MFENELIADVELWHRIQGDTISVIGGVEDFAGMNRRFIRPENDTRALHPECDARNRATFFVTSVLPQIS